MKLGLALGGGGARGLAHLGVLQRLQEHRIHIDCVAGTSIGAIVAGVMGTDNLARALAWCGESDWLKLPSLVASPHFTRKALVRGDRIERLLAEFIPARDFTELRLPCACVATDLRTGEKVVMRSGDLPSAVRASMSIPGVFRPVEREGRILVDGGLVDPLPVDVCRELGADRVIAVDIAPRGATSSAKPFRDMNVFDVLMDTYRLLDMDMTRRTLRESPADILVHPQVDDVMMLDFRNAERVVEAGRRALDERLADIVACIEWSPATGRLIKS